MFRFVEWIRGKPAIRYLAAAGLAMGAQIFRFALFDRSTALPFITYAPFAVAAAVVGGFGPGMLSTILCTLETVYFATEPVGSFRMLDATNWHGVVALILTGMVASILAEQTQKSSIRLAEAHRRTAAILESISDGFVVLDRDWRYSYSNPAAARMLGKSADDLLGGSFWEIWPQAADLPLGTTLRESVAGHIPLQVETYYPEPLSAWLEVRCYPTREGLSLFLADISRRVESEEQLRVLESAAMQTSDGILILKNAAAGSAGELVFSNPAFERITGYDRSDLRSGAFKQFLRMEPERERDIAAGRQVQSLSSRKNGAKFWAEVNDRPLTDEHGRITHSVFTLRDISERKQAEETALLLSAIVEDSDDAIIAMTLGGIILSWNRGAAQIYGYTGPEMIGHSISRLIPPDRDSDLHEIIDNLRRGARTLRHETERVRKDGQRISVSLTISPMQNSEGYVVGASVIARDITDRRRSEKALALSEERYRSLVVVSSQIVWTTNSAGEVVESNLMWREFTGQTIEEILGVRWMDALHPDDRHATFEIWSRAVQNRSFYDTEYRLRRRDSEYRWMAVHGVPVFEEDGSIREWVGTCADIHDRKIAEEQILKLNEELEQRVTQRTAELESANKELEAFAYSVSHDLRAPLRAVDGFSRILLEEYSPQLPSEAQRYLSMARNNAVQMGNLIDDLLAFSRLGRHPICKQSVLPSELVKQALEDLRSEHEGRRIEVAVGDLPACEGDPHLLKQVYINLLSNGLKYTSKQEVARIEVGSLNSNADGPPVYFVRDNGVGFDMRYSGKLFGVFQRLHGAQEYPGTGVGLAIVQRIVHRHGGRIWAEAAVNRGATFYFVLGPSLTARGEESLATCSNRL